jgi:hypothetical protein
MNYKKRATAFFEKYAPDFADNEFAVSMLANEFEAITDAETRRLAGYLLAVSAWEAKRGIHALGRAVIESHHLGD